MRVVAVPGKEPSRSRMSRFTVLALLAGAMGQGFEPKRQYPWVRVVNSIGESRLLFETSTWEEAVSKAERVQKELIDTGLERWSDRYSVPRGFINGEPMFTADRWWLKLVGWPRRRNLT